MNIGKRNRRQNKSGIHAAAIITMMILISVSSGCQKKPMSSLEQPCPSDYSYGKTLQRLTNADGSTNFDQLNRLMELPTNSITMEDCKAQYAKHDSPVGLAKNARQVKYTGRTRKI